MEAFGWIVAGVALLWHFSERLLRKTPRSESLASPDILVQAAMELIKVADFSHRNLPNQHELAIQAKMFLCRQFSHTRTRLTMTHAIEAISDMAMSDHEEPVEHEESKAVRTQQSSP